MRLEWFQVQGYKNFRDPVRLVDLGRFNVIHGDNNVGKSNLLESIGLFFVALQVLREEARGGPSLEERYGRRAKADEATADGRPARTAVRSFSYFADRGYGPDDIFDLKEAQPIVLDAGLQLDCEASDPPWVGGPIVASIRLVRGEGEVTIQIEVLRRADGTNLASTEASGQEDIDIAFALVLKRLGPRLRLKGKEMVQRFVLVRADRTTVPESPGDASPIAMRGPLPPALGKVLLDAENATDARRQCFNRFVQALECVRDLIGPGTWRMRVLSEALQPELCLDPGSGSPLLPVRLMGSGIQQIVILCAYLVMTETDIVAIEEPELNLRWSTQRVLRDVLDEITRAPGGPQLMLSSHSGQFEKDALVYLLTRSELGPRVHKQVAEQGWAFTQPDAPAPASGARAPYGYVTMEGLVQVPPEVQKELGLGHGGGVVFARGKDRHYRMLTDDQYADLFDDREPQQ
jgi:hypothetical protein